MYFTFESNYIPIDQPRVVERFDHTLAKAHKS